MGSNDDVESGNTNSALTRTLSAGTYTVEATTYDSAATGSFTLSITPTSTAAPAGPDVVVESPSVSPDSVAVGGSFTLSATVRNQGGSASEPTTLRYYRSIDSDIDRTDAPVGRDDMDGLGANVPSSQSIVLVAPSPTGTYYYGACVDAVPNESNTGNNCSTHAALTVTEVPSRP